MTDTIKWSSVVQKAQNDPHFKSFLVKNPRAAIEQATDVELPADVEFVVHEQSLKQVHLVLPLQKVTYAVLEGDGDEKAIFVEPDDSETDKKAIFVEPDDADSDEKAIFVEPDDSTEK